MEYYTITPLGRQMIPQLKELGRDDEADILDYLRINKAATAQRISDGLPLSETDVRFMLINLARENWVKRKRTRMPMW